MHCFDMKADELLDPGIRYPVGLLLVEVPKSFAGPDHEYLRCRQTFAQHNQSTAEKQASVDAEVARFRAEQERV